MAKLTIDVDGVDKTIRKIKRDLNHGMENAADALVDNARSEARKVISEERAIFNSEVYAGFKDAEVKNTPTTVRKKLYNDVDHADPLEHGATYTDSAPPVQALLPWVSRKMDWSPGGGGFDGLGGGDGSGDGGGDNGGATPNPDPVDEQDPEEDYESNWEDVPTDYIKFKDISEGGIVESKYPNSPIREVNLSDGLVLGWNNPKYKIKPGTNGFDVYINYDNGDDEWEFIDQITDVKYYKTNKEKDKNIIGFEPESDDGSGYNFYRFKDIPSGYNLDYDENKWSEISKWENNIGVDVVFRDDDGFVNEGTVSRVVDDTVKIDSTFSRKYTINGSKIKIIGIEDIDYNDANLSELYKIGINGVVDVDLDNIFGTDDYYLKNREGIFQNYKDHFGTDTIDVYSSIEDWKSGGSKNLRDTSFYSTLLKTSLNVNADTRGGDDSVPFGRNHKELAKSLNGLSVEFLKRHYDDDNDGRVKMYRTLRNEAPTLAQNIWDNPGQDEWEIETNVVRNYTTTRSNLEGFEKGLLHSKDVDVEDDVLIAIDALIHSDLDREGEVHLRGDYNTTFKASDLDFESDGYSDSVDYLTDQFFEKGSFSSFQDSQMDVIASTIRQMGKNRTSVNTEAGKDRVRNFIDEFLDRGLESNTDYDAEQWSAWKKVITGDGETLRFGNKELTYSNNWSTYDPTQVDVVKLDETYDTQRVELVDIQTDQIVKGKITNRSSDTPEYDIELDTGKEIHVSRPSAVGADDYKIIAGKDWSAIGEEAQNDLIQNKVLELNFNGFSTQNRVMTLRGYVLSSATFYKDKKQFYNFIHRGYVEHNNNLGSHGTRGSKDMFAFGDNAELSTVLHETIHASHKDNSYNSVKYPKEKTNKLHHNVFNEDGENKTSKSWTLSDVLLQTDYDDPPGVNDDGSFPDVVKKRVEDPDPYDYESFNNIDQADFLHPTSGDFEVGDRIDLDTPGKGRHKAELKDTSILDFSDDPSIDADEVTVYELNPLEDKSSVVEDLWVDKNGELTDMRGVVVYAKADQPDEKIDKTIPDIQLEADGYEKLVEAANIAFMEMVYSGTVMNDNNKSIRADSMPFIGRPYSARAANETLTTVSEILIMTPSNVDKSWKSVQNLELLMERYPYLIDAWLEQYNPSSEVEDILNDNGWDL